MGDQTMQMLRRFGRLVHSRSTLLRIAVLGVLVAAVPLAYGRGLSDGRSSQAQMDRGLAEMEQKVIAWVVDRNPQATIREFADFPRVLIEVTGAAGLDFRIILAIIDKESGFKPDAVGRDGEIGLMQLLPSTAELVAKRLGLEYRPPTPGRDRGGYTALGSLADPRFNLKVGTMYLRWQIDRYGHSAAALRAYNRNPDRALEHRPLDRYAEDVSLRFFALAHALR